MRASRLACSRHRLTTADRATRGARRGVAWRRVECSVLGPSDAPGSCHPPLQPEPPAAVRSQRRPHGISAVVRVCAVSLLRCRHATAFNLRSRPSRARPRPPRASPPCHRERDADGRRVTASRPGPLGTLLLYNLFIVLDRTVYIGSGWLWPVIITLYCIQFVASAG